MRRVLIIGSGGAGKSTLARTLGLRLGLRVIHLDQHYWHPGWTKTPEEEWRSAVRKMVQGESWIIDGNYGGTFDIRFPEADIIIDLDYPPLLCLGRAVKRILRYPFVKRLDMAAGCPEKLFDGDFYRWIWRFRKESRPRIEHAYEAFGAGKTIILSFKKPAALDQWLATLPGTSYTKSG